MGHPEQIVLTRPRNCGLELKRRPSFSKFKNQRLLVGLNGDAVKTVTTKCPKYRGGGNGITELEVINKMGQVYCNSSDCFEITK